MSRISTDAGMIGKVLSMAGVIDRDPENPVFRPGLITVDPKRLDDPDEVRARLDGFDALTGWVQTTSDVKPFDRLHEAQGHVLCAELAGPSTSLHVRQDGRGGWIVSTMETTDGDGLVTEKEFFTRRSYGNLHYQVCWKLQDTMDGFEEWRPYAARLIHRTEGE